MVPKLLGIILLLVHLRVQAFHHPHHGIGLLRALGTVPDGL